ncbi:MAG: TetR/AcrR family transcriptional regulator [Proteobacteria bacterium]|nr:TetR/AcrR family transcriptional regulator [Pseudomonadota bacterium]
MPWEKKFDEEAVLDKAMHAFWRQGYEATSMRNLVDCMGINPGSIYAAFGDKRTLFQKTLDHYEAQSRSMLAKLEEKHGPLKAILAVFEHMVDDVRDNPDNCGCFMVNSILEGAPKDKKMDKAVQKGIEEFQAFFRRMIKQGQKAGEINAGLNPAQTARILQSLVLGGRVLSRGRSDIAVLKDTVAHVKTILK